MPSAAVLVSAVALPDSVMVTSAINEVLSLIRKRRFAMALGYGAATVAVPLACVALGFGIAMLGGHA